MVFGTFAAFAGNAVAFIVVAQVVVVQVSVVATGFVATEGRIEWVEFVAQVVLAVVVVATTVEQLGAALVVSIDKTVRHDQGEFVLRCELTRHCGSGQY